jgi:peptidoglycan/LPS O-acetylase OafA/YrhL
VGVDVFFVISGFLITSIIRDEMAANTFSLGHFYERRIRRIFPALFLMIGVTLLAAILISYPPADLAMLAKSTVSTTFFLANYFFIDSLAGGYFSPAAETQPLLHTWSLAVEEQFYLAFPALLLLLRRLRTSLLFAILLTLLILSLGASEYLVRHDPVTAFFSTPTRAWELLLGALLSFGPRSQSFARHWRCMGTFAGLALIALSIIYFDDEHQFPGYAALLPTLGASAIILSNFGTENITGGLLRHPVLVYIGKISYPLYLWHWPVLVGFFTLTGSVDLEVWQLVAAIGLTFVLSALTWRFVEIHFRFGGLFPRRKTIFLTSAALMLTLGTVGHLIKSFDGLPGRLPERIQAISNPDLLRATDSEQCLHGGSPEWLDNPNEVLTHLCQLGPEGSSPDFVLWGDSHAEAIRSGVAVAANNLGLSGVYAGYGACPPIIGLRRYEKSEEHQCTAFNNAILQLVKDAHVPVVILHGRWALAYNGDRYEGENGKTMKLTDGETDENAEVFEELLGETVAQLQSTGVYVIIVTSIPEISFNVPTLLTRKALADIPIQNLRSDELVGFERRNTRLLEFFEQLRQRNGVTLVRPDLTLCNDEGCLISSPTSEPFYYDNHHLSITGARYLAPLFESALSSQHVQIDQ